MSVFFIRFWLSLHRGRGWEREVKFCGRINKREIVSKWFLRCSCLVFSRSFVPIVKLRNVFKTWESKNSDKSERNGKPG